MNRLFIYLLSGFLASLVLYMLIQSLPDQLLPSDPKVMLQEAERFYQMGETAKTVDERKRAFNQALNLYEDLEKGFHPDSGNGKLFYNIANTYYQLDETPLAVFYYYRAQALAPRDLALTNNLSQALHKLNISPVEPSFSARELSLVSFLSLPERLQLFFGVTALGFGLASLYIWRRFFWLKPAIALVATAIVLLLGTLFYSRYIAPQEAVLVKSSILYRDAGEQYAKVTAEPLPAGLKVEVITIREQGAWLKILTSDGSLGYVQSAAIRLL